MSTRRRPKATTNHTTRRQKLLPQVLVYPHGADGRGVSCPSTSITCAAVGCTRDCTKPLSRMCFGSISSIGEENWNRAATTPNSPPATVTRNSQASNRTSRRRGSSASVRLPAYSSRIVSARYSTSRNDTGSSRLAAVPGTVPAGSSPSAPTLTTRTARNSAHTRNPGGSAMARPARRCRTRITTIGTAASAKMSTPNPSAHHSGYSSRIPVSGQPGRSGRNLGRAGTAGRSIAMTLTSAPPR